MYNTVLGAKPLLADGHAFYYADYNFSGKKVYSDHRFPCCSGTLPQVATDYRINSYFHDERGIFVNLYLPSTLRWRHDGASVSLSQRGDYPFADDICFDLGVSRAKEFAVHLRIPEWAEGPAITVNGKRWQGSAVPGTFATISRKWHSGDRIDLQLPRKTRLEAIAPRHPETVALLCGPLVLFPITDKEGQTSLTRTELLAARQTAKQVWHAGPAQGLVTLLPYVAIDEQQYSTYLRLS